MVEKNDYKLYRRFFFGFVPGMQHLSASAKPLMNSRNCGGRKGSDGDWTADAVDVYKGGGCLLSTSKLDCCTLVAVRWSLGKLLKAYKKSFGNEVISIIA